MQNLTLYLKVVIEIDDDITAAQVEECLHDNVTDPGDNMLDHTIADEVKQGHYTVTDWSLPRKEGA